MTARFAGETVPVVAGGRLHRDIEPGDRVEGESNNGHAVVGRVVAWALTIPRRLVVADAGGVEWTVHLDRVTSVTWASAVARGEYGGRLS